MVNTIRHPPPSNPLTSNLSFKFKILKVTYVHGPPPPTFPSMLMSCLHILMLMCCIIQCFRMYIAFYMFIHTHHTHTHTYLLYPFFLLNVPYRFIALNLRPLNFRFNCLWLIYFPPPFFPYGNIIFDLRQVF